MFARISKYFEKKSALLLNPLKLDSKARDRLEVERRKRGMDLHLEIKIMRDKEKSGAVHIGFVQASLDKPVHQALGQVISSEDFESLTNGLISYEEEEGKYLFYPNIDLVWEDSPRATFKRIRANKPFTKKGQTWSSDAGCSYPPIKSILTNVNVISCYAKGTIFQIEVKAELFTAEIEEEISEYILIYFSRLYPPLA